MMASERDNETKSRLSVKEIKGTFFDKGSSKVAPFALPSLLISIHSIDNLWFELKCKY